MIKINASTQKFASVLLILLLFAGACSLYCPDEINVSIGSSPSLDVGNRASIKRLSDEVRRCPKAKEYSVFWKVEVNGREVVRRAALYKREYGVGYEDDPGSGFSSKVYNVSDDAIHTVAQQDGTFEDFANYKK